jgi:hypothetical protein
MLKSASSCTPLADTPKVLAPVIMGCRSANTRMHMCTPVIRALSPKHTTIAVHMELEAQVAMRID